MFLGDVEELNLIIKKATAVTRFAPVGFVICAAAFPIAFLAIYNGNIGAEIGIAFLIFFIGFAIFGGLSFANAWQLQKAMGTDMPAAINRLAPLHYERHGVGLSLETYQTQSSYYSSGCPVPLMVRGTQALVGFAPLAFMPLVRTLFFAARPFAPSKAFLSLPAFR